jgi:hypothetical protein
VRSYRFVYSHFSINAIQAADMNARQQQPVATCHPPTLLCSHRFLIDAIGRLKMVKRKMLKPEHSKKNSYR